MPYDSNGNASINRNRAVTGQTVQAAQVNTPFDDVQSMLSQVLLRSGVAPMTGNLNMNGFRPTNLADGSNDSDAATIGQVNQITRYSAGFISPGFNISNNSSDTANDIDFPSGAVASEVSPIIIMTHNSATSQLDVAFGTGNGGRFDSSISDGWWHCFVISDGITVSRGFSKFTNPTSQSNYPTGFSSYRRVGSIYRFGGVIRQFTQRGNDFDFRESVIDVASTSPQPSILFTLTVPMGIVSQPKIFITQQQSAAGNCQTKISSAGESPQAVLITTSSGEADTVFLNGGFFTNTSSQIQYALDIFSGSLSLNILATKGWIDPRGQY